MSTSERGSSARPHLNAHLLSWGALALLAGLALALVLAAVSAALLGVLALAALAIYSPFALLAAVLVLSPLRTLIQTEASLQLPLDIGQLLLLGFAGWWSLQRL
ncbi:MAG: hypothetical protein SNJ54_06675, partial [Anaerolineae bacterium]